MDINLILYVLSGAAVGLAVGITGVGGGSLMTPILLMFNYPPHIAIGTDLLYAAITKAGGVVSHQKQRNIDWPLVKLLAAGSLPAAIITSLALFFFFDNANDYSHILTSSLGFMLVLTSLVILFRQRIIQRSQDHDAQTSGFLQRHSRLLTLFMGMVLGVLVTLSSVGAGAIGAAILMTLYPFLPARKIVGVDIAHAVPLTFIAGTAHLFLGNVDFLLLGCLLLGSLPAIHIGARLSKHIPNKVLQPILATILMGLGLKFVFL